MSDFSIDELSSKLEILLKKTFGIDSMDPESTMEDIPEWNSFKHLELIIEIEKEFKIKLEFTDTIKMNSIPLIKNKIVERLDDK
jgi:acyl carrier protein|tara:strand:+ start:177 stop:428 length:252 start_codon:yes stop_codon:yes gene_type:complete